MILVFYRSLLQLPLLVNLGRSVGLLLGMLAFDMQKKLLIGRELLIANDAYVVLSLVLPPGKKNAAQIKSSGNLFKVSSCMPCWTLT